MNVEQLLHGKLCAGNGDGVRREHDLAERTEVAILGDLSEAYSVGRYIAPLASHSGEALRRVTALLADHALRVSRDVALAHVVVLLVGDLVEGRNEGGRFTTVAHRQVLALQVDVVLADFAFLTQRVVGFLPTNAAKVPFDVLRLAPCMRDGVFYQLQRDSAAVGDDRLEALVMADEIANFAGVSLGEHAPDLVAAVMAVDGLAEGLLDEVVPVVLADAEQVSVDIVALRGHSSRSNDDASSSLATGRLIA